MRLLALAAVAALALAACGGSGGDDSDSGGANSKDADAIRKIIRTASETKDPSKCSELATQRFLEQIQFQKGRKALEECRKDAKNDDPADSVDISSVTVDGSRGKATYLQNGGDSDGQQLTIDFVKAGRSFRRSRPPCRHRGTTARHRRCSRARSLPRCAAETPRVSSWRRDRANTRDPRWCR